MSTALLSEPRHLNTLLEVITSCCAASSPLLMDVYHLLMFLSKLLVTGNLKGSKSLVVELCPSYAVDTAADGRVVQADGMQDWVRVQLVVLGSA